MNKALIIFISVQFISVICSTIKYIITGRSNIAVDVLINAICVGISSLSTLYLVKQSEVLAMIIPIGCTLIGVPIARLIVNKFTPDRLCVFSITVKCNAETASYIKGKLKMCNISSYYNEVIENKRYEFTVYSENKEESRVITTIFEDYQAFANIVETKRVKLQ